MRFVPYGVFIKVFEDINGLIHLSELSQKSVQNPNEIVKIGETVKAKLILLDIKNRKIGLSMKDIDSDGNELEKKVVKKPAAKKPSKGLEDVVKRLEEDKD
jgi:ribosomal protein S1